MSENNETGNQNSPKSPMYKTVLLSQPLEDNRIRCTICEYNCELGPSEVGVCQVRFNRDGQLYSGNYGALSKADLERIEAKNFYHFFPSSKIFSLGSFGRNLPAIGSEDLYASLPAETPRNLPIERIIKFAIEQRCRGVVFAYSEPSMWYEYIYDALRVIKANGMFTGLVTNGFMSTEALENIGHYVDGILLEVNAISEQTFKTLTGHTRFQKVLETATRAQRKHKIHLEIMTRFVPGINDDEAELRTMATWIKQVLGENTAWHLFPADVSNQQVLIEAKKAGEAAGLNFVYSHQIPAVLDENTPETSQDSTHSNHTYCHKCHRLLVQRSETAETLTTGLEKDLCVYCGAETGIHSTIWKL